MLKKLNVLFSGGAGWLIALLLVAAAAFGGGLYLEYKDAINDKAKAETLLKDEKAITKSLTATVESQLRTSARKDLADKQNMEDENAILSTTDSDKCSTSEPISVALDRLRDEWGRRYLEDSNND